MKKEQIQIKPSLSMQDRILMPRELMDGYFVTAEKGAVEYAPYYIDMVLIQVFFLHCVDGLTFDEAENCELIGLTIPLLGPVLQFIKRKIETTTEISDDVSDDQD